MTRRGAAPHLPQNFCHFLTGEQWVILLYFLDVFLAKNFIAFSIAFSPINFLDTRRGEQFFI